MSTEDGPGIRTTVFFKGCPFSCTWCHNPESIAARPRVLWQPVRCMDCGLCLAVCPTGALSRGEQGIEVDMARCQRCGACVEECPTTALELVGTPWELGPLVDEVVKDRAYFQRSGGGVTVSGGEPGLQAPFVGAFLARCRALGVHTALDTCGHLEQGTLLRLARQADLVLYDLKLMDPAAHRQHTGHDNQRVLDNLRALVSLPEPPEIWIRTPLVPGITATAPNLAAIGAFLARVAPAVSRWELCAFNNLCRDKYLRLGAPWVLAHLESMTRAALDRCGAVARRSGFPAGRVVVTGAARPQVE